MKMGTIIKAPAVHVEVQPETIIWKYQEMELRKVNISQHQPGFSSDPSEVCRTWCLHGCYIEQANITGGTIVNH